MSWVYDALGATLENPYVAGAAALGYAYHQFSKTRKAKSDQLNNVRRHNFKRLAEDKMPSLRGLLQCLEFDGTHTPTKITFL